MEREVSEIERERKERAESGTGNEKGKRDK